MLSARPNPGFNRTRRSAQCFMVRRGWRRAVNAALGVIYFWWKRRSMRLVLFAMMSALPMIAVSAQPKTMWRGEVAFRAHCIGCHSIGCNRSGPKLQDIFGRKAGSIVDFKYMPGPKGSGIVWSEESLDALLRDPGRLVPGTVMASVVRVESADDRREILK